MILNAEGLGRWPPVLTRLVSATAGEKLKITFQRTIDASGSSKMKAARFVRNPKSRPSQFTKAMGRQQTPLAKVLWEKL